MKTIRTVFGKEVIDNFRDRRTLISALVMGPLFGPILFAFVINLSVSQSLQNAEEPLDLPVIGSEHAPNLMAYLGSRNINVEEGPASREAAIDAVSLGEEDVVLVIDESFGDSLKDMVPATIEIITDQANTQAEAETRRARRALYAYSQEIAAMRLTLRGVSPTVMRPLNVDEVDVSTPSGRSAILLGMLSYFFIFALLTGGMNLAIDATAGERERGSLEPLLCLPVKRDHLIFSLTCFHFVLKFMPLEELGMTPNFGPIVVVQAFLLLVPFALVGASLMTLVASFTKSFKEAQTWVSVVLLAPTMPIIVVSILQVRPSTELMFIPSLSQHLMLVGLIRNEPLNLLHAAVSVIGTLAIGAMLTWVCARLYRREGLLG
jgi:sodium transport system permease protein